jgi:hypothetical protein
VVLIPLSRFLFCFFLVMTATSVSALDVSEPQDDYAALYNCQDERLSVSFYCHPEWNIQSEMNSLLLVINPSPYITMTISRSPEPVFLLTELTDPLLVHIGDYAEGFQIAETEFAGRPAREVVGVSRSDAQTGLLDYFVNYQGILYHVQFAVTPKTVWSDARELILKVRDSFRFIYR